MVTQYFLLALTLEKYIELAFHVLVIIKNNLIFNFRCTIFNVSLDKITDILLSTSGPVKEITPFYSIFIKLKSHVFKFSCKGISLFKRLLEFNRCRYLS